MDKLSVVIITLNEEKNLRRCLTSIRSLSDDILVIDSGSTDSTEAICKEFGVQFIQQSWLGYGAQKNLAVQLVKHPYIFSIDADEAPDQRLLTSVQQELQNGLKGVYSVQRLTNYCGTFVRYGGWNPDIKPRIFPKDTCRWSLSLVHETLEIPEGMSLRQLSGYLEHYSYYTLDEHLKQSEKFAKLGADEANRRGKKSGWLKPYLSAAFRFIRDYVFRAGFLDGKAGFTIARISARAAYLKYVYLRKGGTA